jgi:catechol 2,3-dioxygenase-like lactoylglutathione lyase family enzyme
MECMVGGFRASNDCEFTLNVSTVHHVQITIPKGAEDKARKFYCGVMGLTEIEKPESLKGRGGLWVQAGALQIHFGVQDDIDRHGNRSHIAYHVDDVPAWRVRLIEAGFEPEDNVPIPGYDRFEFRDPFGNRVEFIQSL